MADASLARRYSRALVELGQQHDQIDRLGADLASFQQTLDLGDGMLRRALENPGVPSVQKRAVLGAVLEKADYHPLVRNFLRLLIDKGRFLHLTPIVDSYGDMADELAGRVRATVQTAQPLDDKMQAEVQATLASATGAEVVITWGVDPTLIGGLVAKIGDKVIDASVRTRLETLKHALVAGTQLGSTAGSPVAEA
jgi:F-type H+-transporting ATPase subunit delta